MHGLEGFITKTDMGSKTIIWVKVERVGVQIAWGKLQKCGDRDGVRLKSSLYGVFPCLSLD